MLKKKSNKILAVGWAGLASDRADARAPPTGRTTQMGPYSSREKEKKYYIFVIPTCCMYDDIDKLCIFLSKHNITN